MQTGSARAGTRHVARVTRTCPGTGSTAQPVTPARLDRSPRAREDGEVHAWAKVWAPWELSGSW